MRPPSWFQGLSSRIGGTPKAVTVRILAIVATESDRSTLQRASAQRPNWDLTAASTWEEAVKLQDHEKFAIILYDRDLPGRDWRQAISDLAKVSSCVLMASRAIDDELWQEVVERGGYDVIPKPFDEDHVLFAMEQGLWYTAATAQAGVRK